ncbi:MAG: CHAT domain-containing protein, partial [Planctomycetaceae bacterium]|nr:CHAT domain-containing protein [Planctomycetaceae bacterium]
AERLFRETLDVREKLLGKDAIDTAVSTESLAGARHDLGDYDGAQSLYEESLAVKIRILGGDHLEVSNVYNALGLLNDDRRAFDVAEKFHQQSLTIREAVAGPNSATAGVSLHNLGSVKLQTGQYAEADQYLSRSLQISERIYGKDSVDVAQTLRLWGSLKAEQGKPEEAREALERAVRILKRDLGKDHPRVADALQRLTEVFVRQGKINEAVSTQDAAAQSVRRHLSHVLPALSEHARQKYLAEDHAVDREKALSLGLLFQDSPRAAIFSAGWLMNGKSAGTEAIAEAALLSAPEAAPFVYELRSVRDQISALSLRSGSHVDQQTREKLAALETQQLQLQQKISALGLGHRRADPWLTTGELLSRIPVDSVMINIARFRPHDFQNSNDPDRRQDARYVAWIIPPVGFGDVRIVEIGDARVIDKAVAELRERMLADYQRIRTGGETTVEAEFRNSAAELSKQLLGPIEEHCSEVQELILSPDGALWTVPWDALLLSDGRYLIEKYRTRYVLSGRELVYPPPDRSLITSPVVFASPDFGTPPSDAAAASEDSPLRSLENTFFAPLNASAAEAAEIKPGLEQLTREPVRILLGEDATEAAFKSLHRPRILVLSTHGFFTPVPDNAGEEAALYRNPLQQCGLALAGANRRNSAEAASGNDGILTGLEIVGTDLRGTELVVLSACETGLGSIQVGEGVVGLRHSFQLAGVQSVLSSLWQVDDLETARLMAEIVRELAGGVTKSEAVHNAQLARIKSRRERFGAAHPFFWAAFTLTGSH